MAHYRNITDEALFLDVGNGRNVTVDPDELFEVPDSDPRYFQTGEHGEEALFALVDGPTKAKAAPRVAPQTPADDSVDGSTNTDTEAVE